MGNTIDMLRLFVCLSVVLIYLIVLCLFGYEVTIRFAEIDDSIYECGWTELPLNVQRLLQTMMAISQNPVFIEGYFNDQCTREYLTKVNFLEPNLVWCGESKILRQ